MGQGRAILASLLTAYLLSIDVAYASAPVAAVSSAEELANDVARLSYANDCGMRDMVDELAAEMRSQINADAQFLQLEKRYPGLTNAAIEGATAKFSAVLTELQPQLIQFAARNVVASFNRDELAEMRSFLQSPPGQILACPSEDLLDSDGRIKMHELPDKAVRAIAGFRSSRLGQRFNVYDAAMKQKAPELWRQLLRPYQEQALQAIVKSMQDFIAQRQPK